MKLINLDAHQLSPVTFRNDQENQCMVFS